MVDNKCVYEPPHCSALPQGAEHKRPHNFVEKVACVGHYKDTDGKENDFDKKTIEPEEEERTDVDDAPFVRAFVVIWSGDD